MRRAEHDECDGGGDKWWAPEATGGWQSRVVGTGVEWQVPESLGGHPRRVEGCGGELRVEANGGHQRQVVGAKA